MSPIRPEQGVRLAMSGSVDTEPTYNSPSGLVDLNCKVTHTELAANMNSAMEAHLENVSDVGKKVYFDELMYAPNVCTECMHRKTSVLRI